MRSLAWGLIGAGDIVRKRVAAGLRDARGSALVAVSRHRADLAHAFAESVGATRAHSRWQDLVVDPEVAAVYIATPVDLHATLTIAAAEAGKHVLCEKPMAMDTAECDRMIDACRANNVLLGVAYYRHCYPVVERIRALIADGVIGVPVFAQIEAFERFNPRPGDDRAWLMEKARSGGGPMFDFGCHRIELLHSLLGSVRRAVGLTANVVYDREVEDTAIATLQFEHGACAVIAVTHAAAESRDTLRIFGSSGSIHVESLNAGDLLIRNGSIDIREQLAPAANLHQPLIQDFVDAVFARREPLVSGDVGRAVADVEARIYACPIN